ncbi:MAG: ROK family protein [Bacteroidetes bacterium]|nr:ROK family protein [Bacteroidota bacterium]
MSTFLGIDIGGTNIAYGIVNDDFGFRYQSSLKTKSVETADALADLIFNDIRDNYKGSIDGIGIGAPSVNCLTQQIEFAPNLQKWGDIIPLKTIFEERFKREVTLVNDANAAAIGEKHFGDAGDLQNFAVITLGTGIGMGIFVDGRLYTGDNGMAGELGHIVVRFDGRECKCGNSGCLETYIGKKGIIRTAKEKLEFSSGGSILHEISPSAITPLEIFKAAKKEDPVALEVVDLVARDLGYSIALLVNLFDFQNVYLAGGVAKSGNMLRKKTEKYMKQYTLPNTRDKVKLKISEINDKHGSVLGAAAAIREKMSFALK